MSGSAGLGDIDFANSSVSFTADAEGGITLSYGKNGQAVSDGAFVAYFVSLPGSVTLTSIEVVTDQYVYTKAFDGGKTLALSNESFKSLKLDLSTAAREAATPESNTWYKASVLEDGIDYLIVSGGQALKNNGSKAVVAAQSVEIVDGTISLEETDGIIWTANANSEFTEYGTHTLTNGTEHLWRHSNSGTSTLEADNEAVTKYMVWNYDGEYLWNISIYTGSGSASVSDYYAYYSNGWKISTTKTAATLYTTRAPQELAFSPAASAEYDLATESWTVVVPDLTGAYTPVTYALSDDSNPAVATVDADGTVHPLSKGTVKIVATATGNAQYQAAVASYTLRVIDSSVTTNTYIKVTSTSELEVGAQYLLVFEGLAGDTDGDGDPKVFKPILDGNTFSKATGNALDVVIESGTITSDEFEGSHLTLESGYYLKADAVSRYLYPTGSSGGSGTLSAEATATNKLTIAFDNGIAQIKVNSGSNYLVWSTSSHYFSSNAQVSGNYSTGICLYKLDDGRLPQTPSFSPAEVNYDMAGSDALIKPALSDAVGTVTYTSSDETIATVDPSSGDVTVEKKGTVEITASAAGNGQYRPGSASYNLVITDSSNPVTEDTYVKVTSASDLVAGEKYILVYEDGSKVFKPTLNGSNFTTTGNALSATISGGTIVSDDFKDCQLTLESGYYFYVASVSRYLYPTYNNMGAEEAKSSSHSFNISISNGTATISRTSNSSTYNLRYSTSNSYFQSSTSSANVALYKLTEGSNPGGGDDPTPTVTTTYYLASSIEAGKSYVIVSDGKALKNDNGSATAVGVTVNSGSIQVEGDVTSLLWAASTDPDKASAFRFTNNDQTLRRTSGTGVTIGSPSTSSQYNHQWTYNSSSKRVMLERSSTQTYYLYYNGGWKLDETVGEALLYTAEPGSNPGGGDDPTPTPSANTYVRISGDANLVTGTYLIVDKTDTYLFNASGSNNGGYSNIGSTSGITKSGSTITLSDEIASASEFVLTRSGDNLTVKQVGGTHSGKYMYASANVSNSFIDFQTAENNFTINPQTGTDLVYFRTTKGSSDAEYLYKKAADAYFKLGQSGKPGGGDSGIFLYKKADNP